MPSFAGVDISIALRRSKEGTEIDLLVSPNSGRSEIVGLDQWRKRLTVKLRSPPEKGEANAELEKLLTEKLGSDVTSHPGAYGADEDGIGPDERG